MIKMLFNIIILGFLINILSFTLLHSNIGIASLIIILNIIIAVVLLLHAHKYAKIFGMFNLVSLFSIFFAAYNCIFPIQVSIEYIYGNNIEYIYPLYFIIRDYLFTSLLVFISGILFIIGCILVNNIHVKSKLFCSRIDYNISFIVGIMLFLLGIILLLLDYNRIGGFIHAMTMDRVVRMNMLSQIRGNLPYNSFILVGIALMAYSSFVSCKVNLIKTIVTYSCSIFYIILLVLSGDRRFCLYIILIILSLYSFLKKPIILNKRIIVFAILIYILFAIFQNSRWMLPLILRGDITFANAYRVFISNFSPALLLPSSTEFVGPYFSLLYYSKCNPALLGGTSYFYALPYLLPRSLYPTTKVPTISQNFAYQIHQAFFSDRQGVIGWGFNPVAESIANFGYVGPLIIFIFFGITFSLLCKIQNKGLGAIIAAIIMPVAFNLNRADFANTVQEVVYNLALVILATILILIVQQSIPLNTKNHSCDLNGTRNLK